jgi:arylsulfatase A-like enzyme
MRNALLGLLAASVLFYTTTATAQDRPNFVFFLIDDMGWTDAGAFGSTFYETPNIDRLAAGGMKFTNAYAACPVCSPTRASILAGKYPARMNLTDWIGGKRPGRLSPADYVDHLPLDEVTIAEALKEAGYATGYVGKWHLGKEPYYPEHQGFDVNVAGNDRGSPPSYFAPYVRRDYKLDIPPGPDGEYLTDRLTDEAVAFLEANHEKPFLLYLSHYAVHTPLQSKQELTEYYEAKAAKLPPHDGPREIPEGKRMARQVQDHAVYGGMMHSTDDSVGRVLDALENLGVSDNTVVIFMSDNGGLSTSEGSPTSNLPLRAGKGWLYEGGIREPMIIKWPGAVKPGSVSDAPVTSTDFYPTMLAMAGIDLKPQQHVDGVSLVPALTGKGTIPQRPLFWHYPHYGNQGGFPGGAVRLGDYKLIERYETGDLELYNLAADIGEHNDLADAMPDKAAELHALLKQWRADVDARMPTPNPDWKPEE